MAQAATSNQSVGSADRPERSRNAKAQARHRAKRKAYIEQLEQTVTKLQTALALSPEQVAALPPPTLRIRQLEQENAKLLRENDELRRQLHMQTRRPSLMTDPHFDIARGRHSYQSSISGDYPDRDIKRRRMSQNVDEVYLVRCPFYLSLPFKRRCSTRQASALSSVPRVPSFSSLSSLLPPSSLSPHCLCSDNTSTIYNRAPVRLRVHPRQRHSHVQATFRHHPSRTAICPRRVITLRPIRARA
ncbi:hypothetical protein B0F90DRAFT_1642576 [Multifurca ochricompacta]|uniref:BZIP domain-containing protein n=1 Tax=Multifurca ochricompacta TaxID=376703 RepID=A0AAD4QK53_9AGAM|nr:hypothetical protein B0F90DRAFT_1642576 [Multifurca ochricompacta]